VAKSLRELLGISSNTPLPQLPNGKLDVDKLKTQVESKVVNSSSLKSEKENAEKERDDAKAQLDAQKDYNDIKTERDQLKQNFQDIVKKLGLTDNSTQQQVLTKIEELMNKPDTPDNSSKISELEGQLSSKDQRISELQSEQNKLISKQIIVESLKDDNSLSLSAAKQEEIADASSTQEA
jgi:hypothetical protein